MSHGIYSLSGITPLIVDDNQSMRSLMYIILRRLGAERVLRADSAKEAMTLIRVELPDFMIVDYRLGPIDGIALTHTIRTSDESPNPFLPIVMVSGFADPDVVFRARDAGINEFLAKPVSVESIASRVSLMIDKSRPFVRSKEFFGPDRRRRKTPVEETPMRRIGDKQGDRNSENAGENSSLEIVG